LPDDAFDTQRSYFSELAGLIEKFNAAYLSLEWELSKENISNFLDALNNLETFASRSADTKSLLRLMEIILKRLQERPHAINSKLVQWIRDSQGLLAHMLLIDGATGPHEKQQLQDLFARFHDLRHRALAVKAVAKQAVPPQAVKPATEDETRPREGPSLAHLRQLPKRHHSMNSGTGWTTSGARSRITSRSLTPRLPAFANRGPTSKAPDHASLSRRLNGVGNAIEDQADLMRDKRGEFIVWMHRIAKLKIGIADVKVETQKPEGVEPGADYRRGSSQ